MVAQLEEAPLLLCQICSAWRMIALSTPMLWASMRLNLPSRSDIAASAVVQLWLQRSAASPISFSLEELWTRAAIDPTFIELSKSSERWRHVELAPLSSLYAGALAEVRAPTLNSFKYTGTVINYPIT
ncbi:hypothetical protein C8R47DRAFT_998467 [Mycena vitilis]|nr:hypothetical protein C8R47DRAFT_998467 [Mycena vitilis]